MPKNIGGSRTHDVLATNSSLHFYFYITIFQQISNSKNAIKTLQSNLR